MVIHKIRLISEALREAIEKMPRQHRSGAFEHFPLGACSDTSHVLGAFLMDAGIDRLFYVRGERGEHEDNSWRTHAWLARGSWVIDITADQFPEISDAVIISRNSSWHAGFEQVRRKMTDFRTETFSGSFDLNRLYQYVRPSIDSLIGGIRVSQIGHPVGQAWAAYSGRESRN